MADKVTHIGPSSLGVSLKLPESFRMVAGVLGLSEPDLASAPKAFGFYRQKRDGVWGWSISIRIGYLTLFAPWTDGMPFPRRRRDAMNWAYRFAVEHGFEPMMVAPSKQAKPERAKPQLQIVKGGG